MEGREMSWELTLQQDRPQRNAVNGRFLKGSVPFNKGMKWDEWMSEEGQRNVMKGWRNLVERRPKKRPDVAARCRKQVISVLDDGRFFVIPSVTHAAAWVKGCRENVRRCCRWNGEMRVNRKTGRINTDYRYMGVRFYYESDDVWLGKVKQR